MRLNKIFFCIFFTLYLSYYPICEHALCQDSDFLDSIAIPPTYGTITDRFDGDKDDPVVLYIKDIHTSFSAQKNIALILDFLTKQYDIQVIGTEGAEGNFDTSDLSAFPDLETREAVAEYFFNKGLIDGAEYLSIAMHDDSSARTFSIVGIENRDLYKINLNAYSCVKNQNDKLERFIEFLTEAGLVMRQQTYCDDLLKFNEAVGSFHNNNTDFLTYCQQLLYFANEHGVEYTGYKNFSAMCELIGMEVNLDMTRIEVERAFLIGEIKTLAPENIGVEMMQKEIQYKINKLQPIEYISYLKRLAATYGADINQYSNLKQFITYIELYSRINKKNIIDECDALEEVIFGSLFKTDDQRFTYFVSRYVDLLKKCAGLQLSPAMFERFRSYRAQYALDEVIDKIFRISSLRFDSDGFDESVIYHFETFYSTAHQRETALAQSMLNILRAKGKKNGILIAGGYHVDGITGYLRDRGISYAIITPASDRKSSEIPYLSLLSDFRTPLDQLLEAYTGTLKVASWLASEPLAYPDRKPILTVKMKTLFTCTKLFNLYVAQRKKAIPDIAIAQDELRNAINHIIQMAGYESIINVADVEITDTDVIGELVFPDKPHVSRIVVRCSDTEPYGYFDSDIEDRFLEVVKLSTGVTEQFFDYTTYLSYRLREHLLTRMILSVIAENPASTKLIHEELNNRFPSVEPDEADVQYIIKKLLANKILISITYSMDEIRYALSNQPGMDLFISAFCRSAELGEAVDNPLQTEMITAFRSEIDEVILQNYPVLKRISAIMIEPSISLKTVYDVFRQLHGNEQLIISDDLPVYLVPVPDLDGSYEKLYILRREPVKNHSGNAGNTGNVVFTSVPNLIPIDQVQYLHSLTAAENDLWQLVAISDEETESLLISKYQYIAESVAKKMSFALRNSRYHNNSNLDPNDLFVVAQKGLLNAIRAFDPNRGVPFPGYATIVVKNEVRRELASSNWIKASISTQIRTMYTARSEFEKEYERLPNDEELADYMNTSVQKVWQLKELSANQFLSLDEPVSSSAPKSSPLSDVIGDKFQKSPEAILIEKQRLELLKYALEYLPDRERDIVECRYIKEMTLDQVGQIYLLSRERIRQIEEDALERLKNIMSLMLGLGYENLKEVKNNIADVVDNLTPQDREIIMLSFSGKLTDEQIAQRLNMYVIHIRRKRNAIVEQITRAVLSMPFDEAILDIMEEKLSSSMEQLLTNIIEDRETYMLDILEDIALKSFDLSLSMEQVRDSLSIYSSMLSPIEVEVLMLIHYEGKNTAEIAEIINYPQQKIVFILQNARTKIENRLKVVQYVEDKYRGELAGATLDAVNKLPLSDREVVLGLLYDGKSRSELAEEYNITPSGIGVRKWSALKELQNALFESVKFFLPFDGHTDVLADPSLKRFESLLQGILFDIPRSSFSTEELIRPQTLVDVLESVVQSRMSPKIDQATLRQLLELYVPFLNDRDREILMLRYSQGLSVTDVSKATGITVNTLTPIIYRQIMPALESYIKQYIVFDEYGIDKIMEIVAESIEQLPPREKFIIIYYAYDHLSQDKIADVLNITKYQDNHRRKLELAQRHVKDIFLEINTDTNIGSILSSGVSAIRYTLYWLPFNIQRSRFHVPELTDAVNTEAVDIDNIQFDQYNPEFLENLFKWLFPDTTPDSLTLRHLSAFMDTLSEQQFYVLYYRFGENIVTRRIIGEKLNITEETVNSIMKKMKKELARRLKFLDQFTADERSHLRRLLADTIDNLLVPVEYKTMLVYLYYDAMGNKETAEKLGFENPSNSPHQKTATIKKLQKSFTDKIDNPVLRTQFTGSTKNIMEFLYTLKSEIPRERFGIAESPTGRKRADLKAFSQDTPTQPAEYTDAPATDQAETFLFTPAQVNKLFENYSEEYIDELKRYLDYFSLSPDGAILPNPLIVNRNLLFKNLRSNEISAESFAGSFSPYYAQLLRYVFERAGYLEVNTADYDVLLIDIDTLDLPKVIPAYNGRVRRELASHIQKVEASYSKRNRKPHFVFFSQRFNMAHIEAILGKDLFYILRGNGNAIYSNEMIATLGDTSDGQAYREFLLELQSLYPVSRINFKLFSVNPVVQKVGQEFGVIKAAPGETIFSALKLFANIHPGQSANWTVYNSPLTVADIVKDRNKGYFSLAGVMLTSSNNDHNHRRLSRLSELDSSL